jgi:isoleucyl-tRNA synthetase
VVARVTEALRRMDPLAATVAVEELLDDLTNWYVRRSRRRFWKSEKDSDKQAAYATLHHLLLKLCKLLAPFTPFVTEAIYQNLARSAQARAYESVHHCAWPEADRSQANQELLGEMGLARDIAGLGLSARNSANLKVRQPLSRVLVYKQGLSGLHPELVEIVKDELNVKGVEIAARESDLVQYKLLPDSKLLGPRFGARLPALRAALAGADGAEIARRVSEGLNVTLELEGASVELAPGEILVSTQPAAGLSVSSDRGVTVAIDTAITPELKAEGVAREVVRRIQSMRKDAGFRIEDRIRTACQGGEEVAKVIESWREYIRSETLSDELIIGEPAQGAYVESHQIAGAELKIGVLRVGA